MAMIDDIEYPHLTPPDDMMPSSGNLFRSPGDLTDDQLGLLSAAWADKALDGQALAEIEWLMASEPSKRIYIESFLKLHLTPCGERWDGRNAILKPVKRTIDLRRTLAAALAAAAIFFALFTLRPFAERQTEITAPGTLPVAVAASAPEETAQAEADKEILQAAVAATDAAAGDDPQMNITVEEQHEVTPLVILNPYAEPSALLAVVNSHELSPVRLNEVTVPVIAPEEEANWIIKGVSKLSGVISKEKKPADAYAVASTIVNGINIALGWEMELDRSVTADGDTRAVSFSSSLLSISAPVNKNSQ